MKTLKRRAQTRSSTRPKNVSRNSSFSTTSTTSNDSQLNYILNTFDSRVSTPTVKTRDLLFPLYENPEYEAVRKLIQSRRNQRKIDIEATKIQKTFRMYLVRRKVSRFIQSYKLVRAKHTKVFFYILLLNTKIDTVNRRNVFRDIIAHSLFSKKIYNGYRLATNRIYAATGMMATPPFITGNNLAKFVKLCYATKMRNIIIEWHLIARRNKYLNDQAEKFKMDRMSSLKFGNFYNCFILWKNYTKIQKRKAKEMSSATIPQWQHFMELRRIKLDLYDKADTQRIKYLKENGIQALRCLVLQRRRNQFIYDQSVQFNTIKRMKLALAAWVKYLIIQQNKSVTMRFVFRRWLQSVLYKKNLSMLLNSFSKRHEYYQKRQIMSIFLKNRKISHCLNVYQYLRIMKRPSLAIYFLSILRKDIYSEALSHSFNAWVEYVRRRRHWMHFVFQNEELSEYEPKKRAVLALLTNGPPPQITPISLYSGRFKNETVMMYQNVMKESVDQNKVYIIVNGETPDEIKKKAASTRSRVEQRKIFFKLWLAQKNNMSLLMRSAIIYYAKMKSQKMKDSETEPEQCYRQYRKVIAFLASMNLASDGKFEAARKSIHENYKRSLQNRKRCEHRDNLIILSHDSHNDATDLHNIKERFKVDETTLKSRTIQEAADYLQDSFQPLIQLTELGKILEQPNENKFIVVRGCTSKISTFKDIIHECHTKIQNDKARSEIGHDVATKFDRLLTAHDTTTHVSRNQAQSNSRIETFSKYKGEYSPKYQQPSGINNKLAAKFPLQNRKAQVIGNETDQFEFLNSHHPEEEETFDSNLLSENRSAMFYGSSSSAFYNGLSSLSSLMQNTSLNIFHSMAEQSNEHILSNINEEISQLQGIDESDNIIELPIKREIPKAADVEPIKANEIDYTLIDGFDKATMLSLKQIKDMKSPRPDEKYRLFLEILFGKAGRAVNNSQINNLRRKILEEYNFRKTTKRTTGIEIKGSARPVSALIESYRNDKELAYSSRRLRTQSQLEKRKNQDVNENPDQVRTSLIFSSTVSLYDSLSSSSSESLHENVDSQKQNDQQVKPASQSNQNTQPNSQRSTLSNQQKPSPRPSSRQSQKSSPKQPIKQVSRQPSLNKGQKTNIKFPKPSDFKKSKETTPQYMKTYNAQRYRKFTSKAKGYHKSNRKHGSDSRGSRGGKGGYARKNDEANDYYSDSDSDLFREDLIDGIDDKNLLADQLNDSKTDEVFEEASIDPAANTHPDKSSHKTYGRYKTYTPYTSIDLPEEGMIGEVDKVAVNLLKDEVKDDTNVGILVDIDSGIMPILNLGPLVNDRNRVNQDDPLLRHGPGYRNRKIIKAPKKLRKKNAPIIIPNKIELTQEAKTALYGDGFSNKMFLNNGRTTYLRCHTGDQQGNQIPIITYFSPYKLEQGISSPDQFYQPQNVQVVSFKGAKRQIGTEKTNFVGVRINSGKQRRVTKPILSPSQNQELEVQNNRYLSKTSHSKRSNDQIKDMVTDFISTLASDAEASSDFNKLRERIRLGKNSRPSTSFADNYGRNNSLYDTLQLIITNYKESLDYFSAIDALVRLSKRYTVLFPILNDAINKASILVNKSREQLRMQSKNNSPTKPNSQTQDFSVNYLDLNWMADVGCSYRAVVLQYNEKSDHLDAIIADTEPNVKQRSQRTQKYEIPTTRGWDDVIQDYSISEMMLVTPLDVPEQVVDSVIETYQKSIQIH